MAKTALVKCTRKYFDIQLDRFVMNREEIEVSVKRSKELIQASVCELIEIK